MKTPLPNSQNPEPAPEKNAFAQPLRVLKRGLILMVGGTVLLIGVALLVLPGPAFVVIPIGLAILALEFAWARELLTKARSLLKRTPPAPQANEPGPEKPAG